ncbi:hypothetical protein QTH91_01230 [Variovorax dokdonensis]|uniref:Uncharacterized protein n=1 Tax=Variovorax dokdonensis TaxID=344883 RepID=A0ABT7N580_9BURK|nr:hypothetical protein [Variovorax dokdonensis]MDM0043093.1 hypothetical protein [Variovorax dokdonensis]
MTSEVLILNKRAVVLGADSAVTTSGGGDHPRYSKTANKIFELTKLGSVAAAIYGSASIDQVPWEIVLKLFRQHLSTTSFSQLDEYATALAAFLDGNDVLFPAPLRAGWVEDQFDNALVEITKHIASNAPGLEDLSIPLADRKRLWKEQAEALETTLDRRGVAAPLSQGRLDELLANLGPWVQRAQNQINAEPILEPIDSAHIAALGHKLRYNLPEMVLPGRSGIAVTGYGDTQIFPAFTRLEVFGHVGDELYFTSAGNFEVTHTSIAMIQPLAQSSMIDMFTDGFGQSLELIINEKSRSAIADVFSKLDAKGIGVPPDLKQEISASCHESFTMEWKKANWQENFNPLVGVLQSLSVGEMAHLAESLLGLQSLKERVTSASETVGGPIDVAAITKGEGLVWIKRKHYFDPDLNLRFAARLNKSFD